MLRCDNNDEWTSYLAVAIVQVSAPLNTQIKTEHTMANTKWAVEMIATPWGVCTKDCRLADASIDWSLSNRLS